MANILEIVIKYLMDNGFDGLLGDDCSCEIDNLGTCDGILQFDCEPGYKIKCDGCEDYAFCMSVDSDKICPKIDADAE